jgi:hypothetical protein
LPTCPPNATRQMIRQTVAQVGHAFHTSPFKGWPYKKFCEARAYILHRRWPQWFKPPGRYDGRTSTERRRGRYPNDPRQLRLFG